MPCSCLPARKALGLGPWRAAGAPAQPGAARRGPGREARWQQQRCEGGTGALWAPLPLVHGGLWAQLPAPRAAGCPRVLQGGRGGLERGSQPWQQDGGRGRHSWLSAATSWGLRAPPEQPEGQRAPSRGGTPVILAPRWFKDQSMGTGQRQPHVLLLPCTCLGERLHPQEGRERRETPRP